MNEIFELKGWGYYAGGMMIVAAKNEEDAKVYAQAESDSVGDIRYNEVKKLWMLGKTEFEGVISRFEFAE